MSPGPLSLPASLLLITAIGCASPEPVNPSFPLSIDHAYAAIAEMSSHAVRLQRPLLIIGGYCDPGVSTLFLKSQFKKFIGGDRIVTANIGFYSNFEDCRRRVIEAVDRAFPSDDPQFTTEVDVIGASLGGLAARYAAAPSRHADHPRRLHIARLFSISSPHSGAVLTKTATLNSLHTDMHPGSPFLAYLAAADKDARYELFPYVRLGDALVGERYAAPPGQNPLWLPIPPLEGGHAGAWHDPRILADIARRLRNETPFTTMPAAPLPK